VGQRGRQAGLGPGGPRLHRAERHTEALGDLAVAEAVDVGEPGDRLFGRGQVVDGPPDLPAHPRPLDRLVDRTRVGQVDGRSGDGPAAPPAQGVEADPPHDLEQPRAEVALHVEALGGAPRLEERLLHRVGGIAPVPQHPEGKGVHRTTESAVHLPEGELVAAPEPLGQLPVAVTRPSSHGSMFRDPTPARIRTQY
jgi:hypothetical protein